MGPVVDGREHYGWMRYNPLHHWTTEAVWHYVDTQGIPLPPHYAWKRYATFEAPDCMACSWRPEYWQFAKKEYPDVYEKYWPQITRVYDEVKRNIKWYSEEIDSLQE
jgi:3'-phosphoadenosine 5'-phosphosulfate sulfotransferase (PAPS reductase)/FAD synthetase